MSKPKLPAEMARFVQSSHTVYEWDSYLLAKEVPKRMAMAGVNASTLAEQYLFITPQLLSDLTSGRRKWTFELVKRLVSITGKETLKKT